MTMIERQEDREGMRNWKEEFTHTYTEMLRKTETERMIWRERHSEICKKDRVKEMRKDWDNWLARRKTERGKEREKERQRGLLLRGHGPFTQDENIWDISSVYCNDSMCPTLIHSFPSFYSVRVTIYVLEMLKHTPELLVMGHTGFRGTGIWIRNSDPIARVFLPAEGSWGMQLGVLQGYVVGGGSKGGMEGWRSSEFLLFHLFWAFLVAGNLRARCGWGAGDIDSLKIETVGHLVRVMCGFSLQKAYAFGVSSL